MIYAGELGIASGLGIWACRLRESRQASACAMGRTKRTCERGCCCGFRQSILGCVPSFQGTPGVWDLRYGSDGGGLRATGHCLAATVLALPWYFD